MGTLINPTKSGTVNLENYTLIIPSISVGNIGQLTVDLLLSTFKMEKAATLWHPAIVPCVGNDPINFETPEICTACELYVENDLKLAAIQMRSTLEFALALDFLKKLKEEIIKWKIGKVVILASSFAYEMHNINLIPFWYLSNDSQVGNLLPDLKQLEANESGRYLIYGSGFAVKLYEILNEHINCTLLVKYMSEGDNRPDALQMMSLMDKLLSMEITQIQMPPSWQYAFGNPPPRDIY